MWRSEVIADRRLSFCRFGVFATSLWLCNGWAFCFAHLFGTVFSKHPAPHCLSVVETSSTRSLPHKMLKCQMHTAGQI